MRRSERIPDGEATDEERELAPLTSYQKRLYRAAQDGRLAVGVTRKGTTAYVVVYEPGAAPLRSRSALVALSYPSRESRPTTVLMQMSYNVQLPMTQPLGLEVVGSWAQDER